MSEAEKILGEAIVLAGQAHAGQVDRDGQPHIVHVSAVAAAVPPHIKPIAWLHDVVEDTEVTQAQVDVQFGHQIGRAVELLTKHPEVSYQAYLARLVQDPFEDGAWRAALRVKQADAAHNLKRSLESRDVTAVARYAEAWSYVTNAIKEHEIDHG